ncbi:uncharacterized protein C8A04DRAFT_26229 [Dichotomopilus funicola]|uniref:Uncharacterized protein n=1 Tax=Dichotomopilus funicola TaxID=1934379 RepID=A0AAN6V7D2_9PEZI|nr:hypothetical protein C8A04DRAFT_26229 [Dichotomopilus funicola]
MAERLSTASKPRPTSLPTPSTPYTPSPLTPTGRLRLGPQRTTRFTEDMTDLTPAASISERSIDYYWYGRSAETVGARAETDAETNTNADAETFTAPDPGVTTSEKAGDGNRDRWRTRARFVSSVLHAMPCLVLLAILGYAMRVLKDQMGSYMGIQAIILIVFLFVDVLLDVVTLIRVQKHWLKWGLWLRFTCGIAYFALFLTYVGLGNPFPEGYTYWALPVSAAAPVVYLLLCITGLWNILYIPITRHNLGNTLLTFISRSSPPSSSSPLLPSSAPPKSPPRTTTTTPPPLPQTTASTLRNNNNNTKPPTHRRHPLAEHDEYNDEDENGDATTDRASTFNPRFSVAAGTEASSISLTWRRWVGGSGSSGRNSWRSSWRSSKGGGGWQGGVVEERRGSGSVARGEAGFYSRDDLESCPIGGEGGSDRGGFPTGMVVKSESVLVPEVDVVSKEVDGKGRGEEKEIGVGSEGVKAEEAGKGEALGGEEKEEALESRGKEGEVKEGESKETEIKDETRDEKVPDMKREDS